MPNPYSIARPLLFLIDPEKAHGLTIHALKLGIAPFPQIKENPALRVTLWDRTFPNPLGLAAGFDKNAEVIGPMLNMGFGFVEAGTVTPKPQQGNPKPRIFRDPSHDAVINRMGFPNVGVKIFKDNIEKFLEQRPRTPGLVGINIGMNKSQKKPLKDYALLVRQLGPLADYLIVNISSPNTPGLRDLQKSEFLLPLLNGILDARAKACGRHAPPLLVKLAPDLDEKQQEAIAKTVMTAGVDGLILTNTTLDRPEFLPEKFAAEKGGLSGQPLKDRATEIIHNFYQLTEGKLPIIGLGGITDADDAYEKIRAGASLVQIYSALVFQGPNVVKDILDGLQDNLTRDGLAHISEAVGLDAGTKKQEKKGQPVQNSAG